MPSLAVKEINRLGLRAASMLDRSSMASSD
jgi:hypothetical protein